MALSVDNNRVGCTKQQQSQSHGLKSRVERALTFSDDFLFLLFLFLWFLLTRHTQKKPKKIEELCNSNFLDTNQASINPYLHWCGYYTTAPPYWKTKKKKKKKRSFLKLSTFSAMVSVKRFARLAFPFASSFLIGLLQEIALPVWNGFNIARFVGCLLLVSRVVFRRYIHSRSRAFFSFKIICFFLFWPDPAFGVLWRVHHSK